MARGQRLLLTSDDSVLGRVKSKCASFPLLSHATVICFVAKIHLLCEFIESPFFGHSMQNLLHQNFLIIMIICYCQSRVKVGRDLGRAPPDLPESLIKVRSAAQHVSENGIWRTFSDADRKVLSSNYSSRAQPDTGDR